MAKVITDENKIKELVFSRYIEETYPSREKAEELLKSGKKLTFYLGIDPTGPDIHLGHTTNLLVLKKIIQLGHKVILLIGDFTAQTGDPTDKEATRRSLTENEVKKNMESYILQVTKILNKKSFDVKYNSAWLKKMTLGDFGKLARQVTVQQMSAREMFRKRIEKESPITVEEFLYPLMQGYDSVAMEVDGEIGGRDQTFNMLVGRDLVGAMLGKEKIVITTKLLEDTETGKKLMNKSEGSYVSLNDSSGDMFGKIMAMPDSAILPLLSLTTEVPDLKIEETKVVLEKGDNPKMVKINLASELVRMYFGEKEAVKAKNNFESIFQKHEMPADIPEIMVSEGRTEIVDLLVKNNIVSSNAEAKRIIQQGGVTLDGNVIAEWGRDLEIKDGAILRVGPRRFYRIKTG